MFLRHLTFLSKFNPLMTHPFRRHLFRSYEQEFQVSVLGASGKIGQPLSLLLKHSDYISELHLYDVEDAEGLACDLAHIETPVKVLGFNGHDKLASCLKDSHVVVIAAGIPPTSGLDLSALFEKNASILVKLTEACVQFCPSALVAVITAPIPCNVPIVSEIYSKAKIYDERKIFGVTTLDVVRANTFLAGIKNIDPCLMECPVICGFGKSAVPIVSKCAPPFNKAEISEEQIREITRRIQNAEQEVAFAKRNGRGPTTATLSCSYAGARFTNSLVKGLAGELDVFECSFVRSDVGNTKYFTSSVHLGEEGIEEVGKISKKITEFEQQLLTEAIPKVVKHIEMGEEFIQKILKT